LVLRGWQARTKQTYRQPQVIECELSLDQLRANDGCVWIGLGPANLARDRLLREAFLTVTFGYSGRDGSGGHVTLDCAQRRGERLAGEEFAVAPRTSYKLRIELSNDTLRVMVNNQTYEAGNVTLPAEDCRLYVRGWQPGNTWRVRNVSVR
jgi:hypothetical protein